MARHTFFNSTVVLLPRFEARAYIEAIGRYRPTWLTAVPPMIAMMLREADALSQTDLSSVESIRMGSAPVSASVPAATRAWGSSILKAFRPPRAACRKLR